MLGGMRQVAVIGPGAATAAQERDAERLGGRLAALGLTVVTGGLGGVMAAAARGARAAGGRTVGLLPGTDPAAANPWIEVVIPTGLGEARNALVVRSAAVVVAIGYGWGTLSEVALALRAGIPVVSLRGWAPAMPADPAEPLSGQPAQPSGQPAPSPVHQVGDVDEAVAKVLELLEAAEPRHR